MEITKRIIPIEKLDFIASVLKALSHPIRLRIVEALESEDRMNVQDIAREIGDDIEQSLLSHHLIKMKDKGILDCQREGQYVYYQLKLKEVSSLLDCMESCSLKK